MTPAIAVQLSPNGARVADMIAAAREYEAAGIESVWVGDHIHDYFDHRDVATECFVALGALAASTTRVRLGTMVVSALFRHPSLLAQAAGTMADASGGRFELGIGAGGVRDEHTELGFEWPRRPERYRRLRETIQVVRALQRPGRVDLETRLFRLQGAVGHPDLASVRIVVSALAPGTARLAGALGDEVLVNDYRDLDQEDLVARARQSAQEHGRSITVAMMVPDRETTVAGGRRPGSGLERAEELGADRVVWRVLPPYPDADTILAGKA